MRRLWTCVATVAVLLGMAGCDTGRHSATGFRLPSSGEIERGKSAFLAFECNKCHSVSGLNLPKPTVVPPVPVVLGGETTSVLTDGYLVTSIVNPSHVITGYGASGVRDMNGKSRMPDYTETMTVRQLTDIVAFLQSQYTVRRVSQRYPMVN